MLYVEFIQGNKFERFIINMRYQFSNEVFIHLKNLNEYSSKKKNIGNVEAQTRSHF